MIVTILATVVVLGVLIFVHELGHFVTAKMVDIAVPRFSIGLGPKMIGFTRGETEYVISWLPLGGYVKMAGMEEMERIEGGAPERDEEERTVPLSDAGLLSEEESAPGPRDFESKSLPARALVISAGVIMNMIFAFLVFAATSMIWGIDPVPEARLAPAEQELPSVAEPLEAVETGARVVAVGDEEIEDWEDLRIVLATERAGPTTIRFADAPPVRIDLPDDEEVRGRILVALRWLEPRVGSVLPDSPAEEAGLGRGDLVLAAAGETVRTWTELVRTIQAHPGEPIELLVERDGERRTVTVTPGEQTVERPEGEQEVVGYIGAATWRERPGLVAGLGHGARQTWDITALTVDFLAGLFTGDYSARDLGGPILIGQVSGQVARAGLDAFLQFMALFSVNLAVINLLPIPVLDGGHLMFLAIEGVRGRPLTLDQRMRWTQVGFFIVVGIMIWAIANDILRLFGI